jgi:hypothetical protein
VDAPSSSPERLLTGHILIPLALYHAMAECYYGGKPRFKEVGIAPPPAQVVQAPVQRNGPTDNELARMMDRMPPEYVPKGFAARRMAEVAEAQKILLKEVDAKPAGPTI